MVFSRLLPLISLVVAMTMVKGKAGSRDNKRNAAISKKVKPPTTNNNITFLFPVLLLLASTLDEVLKMLLLLLLLLLLSLPHRMMASANSSVASIWLNSSMGPGRDRMTSDI